MSQVAVVIGGGTNLRRVPLPWAAAEGYRVAVVDIQSEKSRPRRGTPSTPNLAKGWRMDLAPDATSEQSVMALARGVDEIFGRTDLLVYSAGIAKRPLSAISNWGILIARCR